MRGAVAKLREALSLAEAALESTTDGILIVARNGRIRSFNRRFVEMWGIPRRIVDSRDDNKALAFVLNQLKDPKLFLARVRELYADPRVESHDSIEFKDGRLFERYSRPHRIGSKIVGRVWSFRDLTQRRRLERDIAQASGREQARIGRELHDTVGQTLTAISLLSKAAVASLPAGCKAAASVARVEQLSQVAIREVRGLARGLLPSGLESGDLETSLRGLSEIIQELFDVPCAVLVRGKAQLADPAAAVELYSIAREAVFNAAKHSHSKSGIHVLLEAGTKLLRLVISDDGTGLPARGGRGLGLAIMRHRAHLLGGMLSIRRGDKRGTVVVCECPRPSA